MKTFYQAIYEWAKASGVESVGIDWTSLADHLSKTDIKPDELNDSTKWLVFDKLKEQFLEEDIEQLAEDKGLTFTKDEVARIKHQYYKMDDETLEQLSVIIDNIVMERGR